jgi:hypothetical protein
MSRGGWWDQIVIIVSASASSQVTDWRAETCSEGPLIVSVHAMVAYGDNGFLLWRVGPQWLQPIL